MKQPLQISPLPSLRTLALFFSFQLLLLSLSFGQTTLLQESFETDGEGSRYTSNTFNDATFSDVWERTNSNPHPYHGTTITAGTRDGSFYWAGEDIESELGTGNYGVVTLGAVNISGYTDLSVSVALGISRFGQDRWESNDYIIVESNIDNAGWNIIGLFGGNNLTLGGALREDTDLSIGTFGPFGTEVTGTFSDFSFTIAGTGSSLQVRVRVKCNGTEEPGFDNIRIVGTETLPVELLDFSGEMVGTTLQLNWQTASELNNEGFEIERSPNGESWETIGFVAGTGTSSESTEYSFLDSSPIAGESYYRLRQIDFDGNYSYSKRILVEPSPDQTLSFYPNPVRHTLHLSGIEATQISILDLTGKLLFQVPGTQAEIDLSHLPNGLYFLRWQGNNRTWTKKIIKE